MYIVTGFYTPNYKPLAEVLSHNLDEHSISHKLYPVEMLGGTWLAQTLRKPEIALRALDEHPDKSIILMDVDCTVHGDLTPLVAHACDVSIFLRTSLRAGRLRASSSSRVVVFHQTAGARTLLTAWQQKCSDAINSVTSHHTSRSMKRNLGVPNDEHLLMEAMAETAGLIVRILPKEHAGAALGICENPLVTHDSAHDKADPATRIKVVVKSLRRDFVSRVLGRPYHQWRYGSSKPDWD